MGYPGGKGRAFQRIINMMPPHATYIESHLGDGAVLRRKRPARRTIGIELDGEVVARWRSDGLDFELVHGCALEFLRTFDFTGGELVYCDPPYWPDARRRPRCYRHDYSADHHRDLLDLLVALPCPVMLSGYDNPYYGERLMDWMPHRIVNQTHVGPTEEVVWTNFVPDHWLHDYSYVGHDFRDRERIGRGRRTQVERLRRAPPIERAAMLSDIVDAFPDEIGAMIEWAK